MMRQPPTKMSPLMEQRLGASKSIFAPGHRIRMNVVPMFLNVFVPWGVFVLCSGLASFSLMYTHPRIAWALIAAIFSLWLFSVVAAIAARRHDPDPTWFTYTAIAVGVMALLGTIFGTQNFSEWSRPYYELQDLKILHDLDASYTPGENVMDGGLFYFAPGNHLDHTRSWHFKFKTTYCVAPIITNSTAPLNQEYSFWAVGTDCCSLSASDFRCGSWGVKGAAGGIRLTTQGEDLDYFKLAVQQAESLYSILAPNPIFLKWSSSPAAEINSWNSQVFKSFVVSACTALVFSIFSVAVMTVAYSWLGRSRSVYDVQFLSGDGYGIGAPGKDLDYGGLKP